ncbi:MAG: PHB depolymerase family esterase [Corynebacterium sp.]|nr:PHB depolymerase family esterase [Corynebacterium sp.]
MLRRSSTRLAAGLLGAAALLPVVTPSTATAYPVAPEVETAASTIGSSALPTQLNSILPPNVFIPGFHAPQAAPTPWAPTMDIPAANGTNGTVWIDTAYGPRRFLIWVPAGYDPQYIWPVMVGIPAYEDSSESFRNYSRMRESTVGREAIIVYPDSWNLSWEGAPTSSSQPGQDIEFIRQVIDRTAASYHIDWGRIYATGMSTGSGMAAILGCHASDLFAGVAPVSGAYYDTVEMNCLNNPIAMIEVHGYSDEQHAYNGGFRYGLPYFGGRELMERYAVRNRCSAGRTEIPLPGGATKVRAEGCLAATEHIGVPGGHLWWYVPNTAEEIWGFLRAQHK